MIQVERRGNESEAQLLKRFRSRVARSGLLREVRKNRWFISKSEERRIARKKAERRQRRKQSKKQNQRKYSLQ